MAMFFDRALNLTGDGEPEQVPVQIATPNLFSVLGTSPLIGRPFNADEGGPRQGGVAIISYGLWQRRFGGDNGIVGRQITLK